MFCLFLLHDSGGIIIALYFNYMHTMTHHKDA